MKPMVRYGALVKIAAIGARVRAVPTYATGIARGREKDRAQQVIGAPICCRVPCWGGGLSSLYEIVTFFEGSDLTL